MEKNSVIIKYMIMKHDYFINMIKDNMLNRSGTKLYKYTSYLNSERYKLCSSCRQFVLILL